MNNADIGVEKVAKIHNAVNNLELSPMAIFDVSREVEKYIDKATRDTNRYRKRLTSAHDILSARQLDPTLTTGLDNAGLTKDMIEDLVFSRVKPVDKSMELFRGFQQTILDNRVARRDVIAGTTQFTNQLKMASKKITLYEKTIGDIMTFLGNKGLLDIELLQALNGSKTSKEAVDQLLELQNKK